MPAASLVSPVTVNGAASLPFAPVAPVSPLSPLETVAVWPSLKWITVLPSGSLVVLVTVSGSASLPAAPVSPFTPLGIVNSLPSEKITFVSPLACGSMLLIETDSPFSPVAPVAPVAPVSPLSPLEMTACEPSLK